MKNLYIWFTGLILGALVTVVAFSSVRVNTIQTIPNLKKFGSGKTADNPAHNPIIKLSDMSGQGYCSAFVIDANYAVTAAHCLADDHYRLRKENIKIYNDKGEYTGIIAKAGGIALQSDLGIVTGDFSNFRMLPAHFDKFSFYHPLYVACGFPYASKVLSCNPLIPAKNIEFAMYAQGYLVPGMSGGPVIDLSDGMVVGVNSAVADDGVLVMPLQGLLGAFQLD